MKSKKCRQCGEKFDPMTSTQIVCGWQCALVWNEGQKAKQEERKRRERKRENRQIKERLKTRTDHLRDAQTAFNAYIRERDKGKPCISCGRYHQGQHHASHFRSIGACSSLRFHEMNVHQSCQPCNTHLSGNILGYRLGLIDLIGQDNVEWLESQPKDHRWDIEDILDIKKLYKEKLKYLKKEREKC